LSNWQKRSTGQGHETINFGGQEVKVQGHTGPKIISRHYSWPLGFSRFYSLHLYPSLLSVTQRAIF